MKKLSLLSLVLFCLIIQNVKSQNIRRDFSWVNNTSGGSSTSSTTIEECTPNVLVTLTTTGSNHKMGSVAATNIPNPPNGCFTTTNTSAAIIVGSGDNTVNITLTFSSPVSNVKLHISDLDSDNNGDKESLSSFLLNGNSYGAITTDGVQFAPPSGTPVEVKPLNLNACGWINYNNLGGITSISFNYKRTSNKLGILLDSLNFDCPTAPNISFDPCCPPMNAELMKTIFNFELGSTLTSPYKIKFTPSTQFIKTSQAFCDYIKTKYPSIGKLKFSWELRKADGCDTEKCKIKYNEPVGQNSTVYNWFTPGGNGILNSTTNFFNETLEINKCYGVHVGVFTEPGTDAFKMECSGKTFFCFRIQVFNGMRKAILSDGKKVIAEYFLDK